MLTKIVVRIRATRPAMLNCGTNFVSSHIVKILMTKLKNPRVMIISGREINFKIGLIIILIRDNTSPQIRKIFQPPDPDTVTSGIKYAAK